MANDYEVTVDIAAPPGAVWQVLGAPCGVTRWYSAYVGCEAEDDRRVLTRADGTQIEEVILSRDDAARFYEYTVVRGVPVRDHRASFRVVADGDGSRVVWRTSGTPEDPGGDLEARLAGRQLDALGSLKRLLEGGAAR